MFVYSQCEINTFLSGSQKQQSYVYILVISVQSYIPSTKLYTFTFIDVDCSYEHLIIELYLLKLGSRRICVGLILIIFSARRLRVRNIHMCFECVFPRVSFVAYMTGEPATTVDEKVTLQVSGVFVGSRAHMAGIHAVRGQSGQEIVVRQEVHL